MLRRGKQKAAAKLRKRALIRALEKRWSERKAQDLFKVLQQGKFAVDGAKTTY